MTSQPSNDSNEHSAGSGDGAPAAPLLRYWNILRRRYRLLVAILLVGITASVLYTLQQTKIYAARSTIVVNPFAPRVLGDKTESVIEIGAGTYWTTQEYYNTQVDILTSYSLCQTTISKYVDGELIADRLVPPDKNPGLSPQQRAERAASVLKGLISAKQNRDSRIIGITAKHPDPKFAVHLANEQVKSYIASLLSKRTGGIGKSNKFLSAELDAAEQKLRSTEQKLYEFKDKHDILSVSLEDRQNMVASDIQRFTTALGDTRIRRMELAEQLRRAQGAKDHNVLESPVFALANQQEYIDTLRHEYVNEKQRLIELEAELGPRSSQHIQQKKKVEELYAQVQAEARRAAHELEIRFQVAAGSESAFASELDKLKKDALRLGPLAFEYNQLVRQQKIDEDNYMFLRNRLNTSSQEGRNEQLNVEELESARTAALVSPRMPINVSIAILLSLLLGTGLIFLLDYLDRTLKSGDEIEVLTGAPLLGMIPIVAQTSRNDLIAQQARDLYVFKNPTSAAAELCRSIRTNILFSSAGRPMNIITISSPRPREGKTTTTIYMGTTMAQGGQRVLMIDTDLRRPRLHTSLGISKNRGLTNLILGDASFDEVIKTTDIPNLYVLPCGPQPPNPAELLMTDRFKEVLSDLAARFDRILLDSPPVLAVTDAVVLSRISDGVVLIAQCRKTQRDDLLVATRQFRDVDAPILGVIMNDIDISQKKSGYHGYYYGQYTDTVGASSSS